MKASLRAFMEGIVDYAGLFPPANLSLDTSIQKYSKYRESEDAWILSRFIIPATKLHQLEAYGETLFQEGDPFAFSVLGKGTETVSEYKEHLQEIVAAVQRFHQTHGSRVTTDILEIKLPREAVFANDADLLSDIYEETARRLNESPHTPQEVYFEAAFEENWKKEVGLVLETLSKHNQRLSGKHIDQLAFKIRCGGVEAAMFPSLEQVAFALNGARNQNLALKATAGLHHPVRHYAESVQTKMHGFFNVFGGAMLSYAHDLSDEELITILKEEDPYQFSFTDEGFEWKDLQISTHEIAELRDVALVSFGSCSFDEPREDLQQLDLL